MGLCLQIDKETMFKLREHNSNAGQDLTNVFNEEILENYLTLLHLDQLLT